jgi:hypothetical protein
LQKSDGKSENFASVLKPKFHLYNLVSDLFHDNLCHLHIGIRMVPLIGDIFEG